MSKRAPKQAMRQTKGIQSDKNQNKSGRMRVAIGALLGVATLIGVPGALLTVLPRISATVSDPTDTNDPFSSAVTVSNTGYIPLRSVVIDIAWSKITALNEYGNPVTLLGDIGTQHFRSLHWSPQNIGPDERFTESLNDVFSTNRYSLLNAEIAIVVEYDLPIIHLHREKRFPFFAKRQRNGAFYWYAETLPKIN